MRTTINFLLALACVLPILLAGCAPMAKNAPLVLRDRMIGTDTIWSGSVIIDGTVKVAKEATLTIAPGTDIAFVRRDADADGLGDATLVVEGRLLAAGTRQQPIHFHSAEQNPRPGDWLEIRVDFSKEVRLRYCDIRDSAYTLHAHFTRGTVEDCTIHRNIDGCRLGQATFTFSNNLIEHNQGKGINFRNSSVTAHHNIIRYNGSGVFLFENDREFDISFNNFYGNLDNFRLGDFYTADVSVHDNWWGSTDEAVIRASIYDHSKDPEIGSLSISPAGEWIGDTGPRDRLELVPEWEFETEGYVDADPSSDGSRLYVASWDGTLYALDAAGKPVWQKYLGDTMDATPVLVNNMLLVQTWSREVYALDSVTGDVHWRFDYSPSTADDHRQGAMLVVDDMALLPAWNGTLFALDVQTGERRWEYYGGQPLRAQPASDGDSIYLASGDGTFTALNKQGQVLWQKAFQAPLLSSPILLNGAVVVVSRAGNVMAFSQNGQELWQRDLGEECYYGAPVTQGDALFVATAGNGLWKLDAANGQVIWRAGLVGPSYATPAIKEGRVYVGDNSGALSVFGVDSGQLLAQYRLEREIQGRPLIRDGRLYIGSRDHKVHALTIVEQQVP